MNKPRHSRPTSNEPKLNRETALVVREGNTAICLPTIYREKHTQAHLAVRELQRGPDAETAAPDAAVRINVAAILAGMQGKSCESC